MMEMDGAGDGVLPRSTTNTPFRERLEAVKHTSRSSDAPVSIVDDEQHRIEKTMALKSLLNVRSSPPPSALSSTIHSPFPGNETESARSSGLQKDARYAPSEAHTKYQQRPANMMAPDSIPARGQADVKSMEADLRKLLKLS